VLIVVLMGVDSDVGGVTGHNGDERENDDSSFTNSSHLEWCFWWR